MTEENGEPKPARVGGRPRSREMAGRDLRIMDMVASGMRVSEIALRERLSKRRIRELIARNLAERERLPPPQFFELQTRRLSEALLVAYAKMNDGNLAAVDRVVTIVRELDRYHGFAPTAAGARGARFERSVPARWRSRRPRNSRRRPKSSGRRKRRP